MRSGRSVMEPALSLTVGAAIVAACLAMGAAWGAALAAESDSVGRRLPEFGETRAERWLNSEPLTREDLRGKVVVVEVWTFGCVNCVRTIPWIDSLLERYGERGLVLIGVHTPEFDYEKDPGRVAAFLEQNGIEHPVLIDNEMKYWRKLRNRYWPAMYLVDRRGFIHHLHIGETYRGTDRARSVEKLIESLLARKP